VAAAPIHAAAAAAAAATHDTLYTSFFYYRFRIKEPTQTLPFYTDCQDTGALSNLVETRAHHDANALIERRRHGETYDAHANDTST